MKNSQKFIKLLLTTSIITAIIFIGLVSNYYCINADDYTESYDRYEEGYEVGYDEGYEVGYTDGYEIGYAESTEDHSSENGGNDVDLQEAYDEGYATGYDVGYTTGCAETAAEYESYWTEKEVEQLIQEAYDTGLSDGYELGTYDGYELGLSDGYETGYDEGKQNVKPITNYETKYETKIIEKYYPIQPKNNTKITAATAEQILNDNSITNKLIVNATELYNYSFESAYRSAVDPMKFVIVGGNTWKLQKIQ